MKISESLQDTQTLVQMYGFKLEQLDRPNVVDMTYLEMVQVEREAPTRKGEAERDFVNYQSHLWKCGIRLSSRQGRFLQARYKAKEAGITLD